MWKSSSNFFKLPLPVLVVDGLPDAIPNLSLGKSSRLLVLVYYLVSDDTIHANGRRTNEPPQLKRHQKDPLVTYQPLNLGRIIQIQEFEYNSRLGSQLHATQGEIQTMIVPMSCRSAAVRVAGQTCYQILTTAAENELLMPHWLSVLGFPDFTSVIFPAARCQVMTCAGNTACPFSLADTEPVSFHP